MLVRLYNDLLFYRDDQWGRHTLHTMLVMIVGNTKQILGSTYHSSCQVKTTLPC